MAIDTREMREKRHKLLLEARGILDAADKEKRALTAEEKTNYDKAFATADELRGNIETAENRNDLDRQIAETALSQDKKEGDEQRDDKKRTLTRSWELPEYRSAWGKYMITPKDMRRYSAQEERALSAGTSTEGGYLYAPEVFVNELIQNVTDETILRSICRVLPPIMGSDSLGVPIVSTRMGAAAWTSELNAGSKDSSLKFGKRAIRPNPLTGGILVSKTLLRKTPMAQQIVREELARIIAEAQENGFMTGTGAQQPLGLFTASNSGISTNRDVSTDNTSSSPTFDGLKSAKYELKEQYRRNATWIFHRDIVELIAKLKDGDGRYLWQDSVVQGEPDRLLGFPAYSSEFAPSTVSSGAYVGILGDFRHYWVVDSMDLQVLRLEELYAESNQDCFMVRMETDGAPVKEEAFVRVTLG